MIRPQEISEVISFHPQTHSNLPDNSSLLADHEHVQHTVKVFKISLTLYLEHSIRTAPRFASSPYAHL